MRTADDRWEHGSDFHWLEVPDAPSSPVPWAGGRLLSSGRDALRLLLELGVRERAWRRLWIPAYFCQHVTAALVRPDLELRTYPDDPTRRQPSLPEVEAGDVVLLMNYFGLRPGIERREGRGVEWIEDHSHDPSSPWAASSAADFCVASLRKTLPIPDGGVVWSPRGHPLPPTPALSEQRRRAGASRLTAMILKSLYLRGARVAKDRYRAIAIRSETALGRPGISAMTDVSRAMAEAWPIETWRARRRENHAAFAQAIDGLEWVTLLRPSDEAAVPFSAALVIDSPERRERIRRRLIAARIYPSVLWPLERTVVPIDEPTRALSRRSLSIHCDGRYDPDDMRRVAGALVEAGTAPDPAGPSHRR